MQGGGVIFRVEAVIGRYPLQAAERGLAAPGLSQPLAALEALDALEGVLATELTCEARTKLVSRDTSVRKSIHTTGGSAVSHLTPSRTSSLFYNQHLGLI